MRLSENINLTLVIQIKMSVYSVVSLACTLIAKKLVFPLSQTIYT